MHCQCKIFYTINQSNFIFYKTFETDMIRANRYKYVITCN